MTGTHFKLIHNRAIVEYYKTDQKKTDLLLKVLTGLSDNYQIDKEKIHECCIAYINRAIVLFHLRQKNAALKIILEVLKYFTSLNDEIIQKLGLLAVHLLLDTKHLKKAEYVLEFFMKQLAIDKNGISTIDENDVERIREKLETSEEFQKLFKICYLRTNLINCQTVVIPIIEEVIFFFFQFCIPEIIFHVFLQTSQYSLLKAHQYYLGNDYQMAAKELSKKVTNEEFSVR